MWPASPAWEARAHFEGLQEALRALEVPFVLDARIVRGLDYYTRTVFEVVMQTEGTAQAVFAGGRYDGLVAQLGGPSLSGMGFGMGLERVLMLLEQQGVSLPEPRVADVYVAALGADARIPALALAQRLRDVGLRAEMDHTGRSLKAQFKHADKLGAPRLVMVGGDELARGTVRVRDMQTREEIEIPLESAAKILAGGKEEC